VAAATLENSGKPREKREVPRYSGILAKRHNPAASSYVVDASPTTAVSYLANATNHDTMHSTIDRTFMVNSDSKHSSSRKVKHTFKRMNEHHVAMQEHYFSLTAKPDPILRGLSYQPRDTSSG